MAEGIALLDEALDLARQEKIALENGAYDDAIELAKKRGELTGMAWGMLDLNNSAPIKNRIAELASLQTQLTSIASRAKEIIRQRLSKSRQEKRRMQGYHMAVGQALQ